MALALGRVLAVEQRVGDPVAVALAPVAEAVKRAGVGDSRGVALVQDEAVAEEKSVAEKELEEEAVAGRVGAEVMEAVVVGVLDSSPVPVKLEDSVPSLCAEGVGESVE